jgi:uncharacterized protein (DUF433 family)
MIRTVEHVQEREGEYYAANTRVPVGVIIASWKQGALPDHIRQQFPPLSLADVYGVITYYLDHQQELDTHFAALDEEYERARLAARAERPAFYKDLQQRIEAWRGMHPPSSQAPTSETAE